MLISIVLGIIAIGIFIWSMSGGGGKSSDKKKKNDISVAGIVVSLILFFVGLAFYDDSPSAGGGRGFFDSPREETPQEQRQRQSTNINDAKREVEAAQQEAKEKAAQQESKVATENSKENSKPVKIDEKELEKQRNAYLSWYNQLDARLMSIDNSWDALWTENASAQNISNLDKSLSNAKSQLESLEIPKELSASHRQRLSGAIKRYGEWIESRRQACQMYSLDKGNPDISNEISRGEGLKLQSKIEIANVGRELGISN